MQAIRGGLSNLFDFQIAVYTNEEWSHADEANLCKQSELEKYMD